MTRPDDNLGHFADLRAGDMYQGEEPPRRSPGKALWLSVGAFTAGLLAGIAFGDPAYPDPPSGPGWEICKTKGC